MPEMTVKYNKEELEDMLVCLLLRPQGLKLAAVDEPIQWRYRPALKVIIHAEVDHNIKTEAPAQEEDDDAPRDPLEETMIRKLAPSVEELDPSAFPPGTNFAALKETLKAEEKAAKRLLLPGESFERKK